MKNIRLKQFIYTSEANILGIISNSLVHRTPKIATLKLVKAEILRISGRLGLSRAETNKLWLDSYEMYQRVSKKTFSTLRKIGYKKQEAVGYAETLQRRQNATYNAVHKLIVYPGKLEKMKNELVRNVEHREKHDELFHPVSGLINQDRASPFWICSSHAKPAKDHADHEGKLYYNQDWMDDQNQDPELKARALRIIRSRKMISIQEITGAPVYLVTRPNCKHFFIPVEIDEVVGRSNKQLLKEHKGYMPDESPISYETRQYRAYYDRLKVLQELRSITPCDELEKDVRSTRRLAVIWINKSRANRSVKK